MWKAFVGDEFSQFSIGFVFVFHSHCRKVWQDDADKARRGRSCDSAPVGSDKKLQQVLKLDYSAI